MKIAIIDYGAGNIKSIQFAFKRLGYDAVLTSDVETIQQANKVVFPGVGEASTTMAFLKQKGLDKLIPKLKQPVLGVCLGMQLMAEESEEGDVKGLGWIEGKVVKFKVKDTLKYKVPHTGWNQITIKKESPLMKDIRDLSEFYFVHAYHWVSSNSEYVSNETEYEFQFPSAVEKNNIFGVQYHPEKSHDVGAILLKNFINL